MSAQEFKVGQTVSGDDFAYLPRGTVVAGPGVPTRRKDALGMWVARDGGFPFAVPDKGMAMSRTITHLPATEPEDKDDLYVEPEPLTEPSVDNSEDLTEPEDADDVEPEPLKEGDWCLVWGQVDKVESPAGSFVSIGRSGERRYFAANAIVRPDEGQTPPWVKPAQCTSLYATNSVTNSLLRCEHEAGHEAKHVVGWVAWTDAEEYGRMVEGGGAS